jgi:hypothetical protein
MIHQKWRRRIKQAGETFGPPHNWLIWGSHLLLILMREEVSQLGEPPQVLCVLSDKQMPWIQFRNNISKVVFVLGVR